MKGFLWQKKMEYKIFYLLFTFILDTGEVCPLAECITKISRLPPINILNRNGKNVQTTASMLQIKVPDNLTEGCFINTTNYIDQFNLFKDNETIVVFTFRCGKVHPIFFTEYEGEKTQNAFGYIQVRYCTIGSYDIQQFFRVATILVLTMVESKFDPHKPTCLSYTRNNTDCSGLENISSLSFTTQPNSTDSNIFDILNCTESFPGTSELSLTLQGWSTFPTILKKKFPNVQTLELEMNNLTVPPDFPWTGEVGYIGHNITRSVYFHEHYTAPFFARIPTNVFRRYLNLNFNNIANLRTFKFNGRIDMISIKNNKLKYIGEYTFKNITGLQSLDLSENLIVSIPRGAFNGLTELRNMNLHNNCIEYLYEDMFSDLQNLIKLDLSVNKLLHLPFGVFSKLENLKVLNLEINSLTVVPTESFPVLSLNLQEVRLHNNPISTFPVVLFYLRHMKIADLKFTNINLDNVTALLENVSYTYLAESVAESSSTNNINILNGNSDQRFRIVDLTGSKIKNIIFDGIPELLIARIQIILKYFKFVLDSNELFCDCRIIPFSRWIYSKVKEKIFTGNEYFFNDWKCQKPVELFDRPVLRVMEDETYCQVEIELCPVKCTCHQWFVSNITIVNCRNRSLTELPDRLPEGTLDLWFENNNITHLKEYDYFHRSRDVRFSHNAINTISDQIIQSMANQLRKFYFDSNYLTSVPKSLEHLSDVEIRLKNNPFICDCKTWWMKSWILKHQTIILDWADLVCSYGNEEGQQFIIVEDNKFICLEAFDSVKHVIAPSVSSSVCIALFITTLASCFIFRLEIKVLIFIYFGFHPFDKDEKEKDEDLDCVVVHSKPLTDWVLEHIVAPLEAEDKAYILCEISRDFVVGFSYQENICSFVRRSKRMILVLSEEIIRDSDIVKIAWNEAQEKIKDMRTNYAIVVCHDITLKMIENKDLIRYIKRGRYINTHDKLFIEKILYCMPPLIFNKTRKHPNLRKMVLEMYEKEDAKDSEEVHAFLTYCNRDTDIALKTLIPVLQEQNYVLHVPDRDFIPGASKEENILKAIDACRHTIFLLSGPYLEDEWSLFTFRTASEKSIRQKCNHMIVVIIDGHDAAFMDEEVKYYLKTHVTLQVTDNRFWQKLFDALPGNNENNGNENYNMEMNNKIKQENLYNNHVVLKQSTT